ncbi:MAG: hypothetical protein JWN04_2633 [Myxococcaceae bacterium]|nr:hypothetical protein [Myxococcaceae bacterium]
MLRPLAASLSCSLTVGLLCSTAYANTLSVGPGKDFAAPCAAFAAASDGDTIEIDAAGSYIGDVCAVTKHSLTIRGTHGRAHIAAGGMSSGGKAIWVIQGDNTLVEDIELSGCSVPDMNGAGIRQEGTNLTVRRSYFHDNQNGILGNADPESVYLFEDSEFANNGAGDGYSHNMYIGQIKSFTLQGSYSHDAKGGHLVKSRALDNQILFNRLTDEAGTASYEIDLPQGGPSVIVGNVLQKSATATNSAFVSFARETPRNPDSALWIVGNTFFNARSAGTFVAVSETITAVTLRNNIFAGAGTVCDLPSAALDGNFVGDPKFVDPTSYDFHLQGGSPAIDKGVAPGMGDGESLAPVCQYVHPAHAVVRRTVGALDQGSFEVGGESSTPCGQSPDVDTDAGTSSQPDGGGGRVVDTGGLGDLPAGSDGGAFLSDAGLDDEPAAHASSGGCATLDTSRAGASLSGWLFALGLTAVLRRRKR